MVIGRFGPVTPDQARRIAHRMLGKVADGQDPADKRARARGMPTLCEAFQDYMSAKSFRSTKTSDAYRLAVEHYLADWVSRPLNTIERREVEARFALLTRNHGWAIGNQVISLLRSVYRLACVDHEAAQPGQPVAGGGRALQPGRAAGDLVARGSPALLAARHRGGGEGPGDPLDLLGCVNRRQT